MIPSLILLSSLAIASPQVVEGEPPAPQARTTVLHLENGTVLRMRARELGGHWEVFSKGEWSALPEGAVLRAKSERSLLDQASKLRRALPRNDPVRRVAYADWLVNEGLFVEALKEIERVLDDDPDQADALALIARADMPLGTPRVPTSEVELDAYFIATARLGGVGREAAILELAASEEVPGLRPRLSKELLSKTPTRRGYATLVLRRLFPGSEAEGLLSRAVLDSSAEVRMGASLALRAFDDPAVIVPALRATGSKHPEVRSNAIEALGNMEYREAVEPLFHHLVALQAGGGSAGAPRVHIFNGTQRAYVSDYDVEVAQFAAIADPVINVLQEGSVLDVAVVGVNEYVVAGERSATRSALSKLTGANPGATTAAWKRWWTEHGNEWQAGTTPPKAPTSPSGQG